jgi:hypothetical protein
MTDANIQSLSEMSGHQIRGFRRLAFVFNDEVLNEGAIEIFVDSGSIYHLDSGSDGESLAVSLQPWRDPFEEPLSEEDRKVVAESGRWTARIIRAEDELGRLVGAQVLDVTPHLGLDGQVIGIVLKTSSGSLTAVVESDELIVEVSAERGL